MFVDKTKEITVVFLRPETGSRLEVKVIIQRRDDPRQIAYKLQQRWYPDWVAAEVVV